MARPKHGGGTVFHRKDGRYVTQIRLRWYEQKLRALQAYLMLVYQLENVTEIAETHIEAFLVSLDVSEATRRGYLQVLYAFFRWCVWKDFVASDPAKKALDAWKEKRP